MDKYAEAEALKRKILAAGKEPRPYSGRGMDGRYCVGVNVSNAADAFLLGEAMGLKAPPNHDACGRGVVLYWPAYPWEVRPAPKPPPPSHATLDTRLRDLSGTDRAFLAHALEVAAQRFDADAAEVSYPTSANDAQATHFLGQAALARWFAENIFTQ